MNLTFSTNLAWHPQKYLPNVQKIIYTRQNCSTQQDLCLRLLMQAIRAKLNVEVAIIPDERSPNHV